MENKLSATLLAIAAISLAGGAAVDLTTEEAFVSEQEAVQEAEQQRTEQLIAELRDTLRDENGEIMFTTEQASEMLCSDGLFSNCYRGADEPVTSREYYGTTSYTYKDSNETVTVQLVGTPEGAVVIELSE